MCAHVRLGAGVLVPLEGAAAGLGAGAAGGRCGVPRLQCAGHQNLFAIRGLCWRTYAKSKIMMFQAKSWRWLEKKDPTREYQALVIFSLTQQKDWGSHPVAKVVAANCTHPANDDSAATSEDMSDIYSMVNQGYPLMNSKALIDQL